MNYEQWARALLAKLGFKAPWSPVDAIVMWCLAEGTQAKWNPLATTLTVPGATKYNYAGVKNYPSAEVGLDATVKTLLGLSDYEAILRGLEDGVFPPLVIAAVCNSPWGTDTNAMNLWKDFLQGARAYCDRMVAA